MIAASDEARMRNFRLLTTAQQIAAIRQLEADGMSAHGIAAATSWAVEAVVRVLVDPCKPAPPVCLRIAFSEASV